MEELSLSMNPRITDMGLVSLADALRALRNDTHTHTHTHPGVAVKLKSLWLWGNPLITAQGANAVANALADDSSHVRIYLV